MTTETQLDVLAEISRNLDRIACALEAIVNASVRNDGVYEYLKIVNEKEEADDN